MKLLETQLPALFSQHLYDKIQWDFGPSHMGKVFDVMFTGTANMLSEVKTKEKPVAFILKGINGVMVAAGIVQYFENEDESNPGNWSLRWTFDEADVPADALKIYASDSQIQSYYVGYALNKYGMEFASPSALETLFTEAIAYLKKWLDENASETEELTIEEDGIFVARVGVEDGEKVFSIEMDGLIKQLIKDDASIEV